MINKTLAHYEVKEKIGEGGMGEVYRAHDTKLSRDVALKVLPESFALDEDRLARFEREARLLAGLNHANIASIYGIEQSESQRFLVLELVDGVDLAGRLVEGPIAEDDALQVCLKVAEALEVAHEQGVIHRDLKPANIKVSPEGTVKVLDFGLAKALDIEQASGDLSRSPTLLAASSPTVQGVILGTAAYMSPEQARGKVVDRRADIWGFGAVLYELLTGKQAFRGETLSDTLASVLKTQPDWEALPAGTPASIKQLLKRCLDKDPKQRLRDIGEARITIDSVLRGETSEDDIDTPASSALVEKPSMFKRIMWPVTAVIFAVLAGVLAWVFKPVSEAPLRKFSLAVESEDGVAPSRPVIAPDGKSVAYVLAGDLWIQSLDELSPRKLPTEKGVNMIFWSPDATYVGYAANDELWKVPVSGGNSIKISDPTPGFTAGRGAGWGWDDRIIYSYGSSGLFQVSAQGGDPTPYLDLDPETDGDFHEPSLLPGGKGALWVTHRKNGIPDTIELLANGERKVLVQTNAHRLSYPMYSATGHVVYNRAGSNGGVWAIPFSLSKMDVAGDPFLIDAEGAFPSTSEDGTLVYLRGAVEGSAQYVWVGRDGVLGDVIGEPMIGTGDPALSPDGTRLAATINTGDQVGIWMLDLERGTRTPFSFEEGAEFEAAWSPDGSELYYRRASTDSIYVRSTDGTGMPRVVVRGRQPAVSRDGKWLVYVIQGGESQEDLWYVPLDGSAEPQVIRQTAARENYPRLSPDGRYLAYASGESGTREIYLTRFPSGEGKWQVSIGGGRRPTWSPSGRKLFYEADFCNIMELSVDTDPAVVLGRPTKLVDCDALKLTRQNFRKYDVFGEGERFVVVRSNVAEESRIDIGVTVIQNWVSEFKDRGAR